MIKTKKIHYNYITTNKINGKRYVGMHSTDNIDDKYLGSGQLLIKAINKYGEENFIKDILNRTLTRDEAEHNEQYLIAMYNTLIPNGYNISPKGGLGAHGCHSEETRRKMEEQIPWNKGLTKETDPRVKNKSKAQKGQKAWNKGKILGPLSEEHKRKLKKPLSKLTKRYKIRFLNEISR